MLTHRAFVQLDGVYTEKYSGRRRSVRHAFPKTEGYAGRALVPIRQLEHGRCVRVSRSVWRFRASKDGGRPGQP